MKYLAHMAQPLAIVFLALANVFNIYSTRAAEQREKAWRETAEKVTEQFQEYISKHGQ